MAKLAILDDEGGISRYPPDAGGTPEAPQETKEFSAESNADQSNYDNLESDDESELQPGERYGYVNMISPTYGFVTSVSGNDLFFWKGKSKTVKGMRHKKTRLQRFTR